jgi:sugar (pentulose or hexulose) kinase
MPIVLGVDVGTTTITAIAVDTARGDILARATAANQAAITSTADKTRGFSEWDARKIVATACACLRDSAAALPASAALAGIGLTGQQHGVVIVDAALQPATSLINWQDRRGEETYPGSDRTYVEEAGVRLGPEAPERTGCKLASGFLASTLFWLKDKGQLPSSGLAAFIADYLAAVLTGTAPVTDATNAAGSGVMDVILGDWAGDPIDGLGLPRNMFPEIRLSGAPLGTLQPDMAAATGLPAGLPVFVGIGDHQASFLGSVKDRRTAALINVGTGAQVAAFTDVFCFDPNLETRPFPRGGYLLACPGLSGGRSYALLEGFFHRVGTEVLGLPVSGQAYERMNELAGRIPSGCDGLRCDPFFAGTRADPRLRASWTGISAENFTPGHFVRALLEGTARMFHAGHEAIARRLGETRRDLIGAGNGMRQNPLLVRIVAQELSRPVRLPRHPEEAAYGAALLATVGAGIYPDLGAAGASLIRYLG